MAGYLLVAHGGGPTAVINASLKGVLDEAGKYSEIKGVLGARYGIEGVLKEDFVNLSGLPPSSVDRLPYSPGSAIGTCRRRVTADDYPAILEVFKKHNIRYFLYNGGNDSMDTCQKIAGLAGDYDVKVIGIPKTIDNDLRETDHCPGFGSAARYAAISAMELGRDVASLPIHVIVMEVMGRNAGWSTASATLGKQRETDPPHLVYLPERPFHEEEFLEDVRQWNTRVKGVLVVASEGLVDQAGDSLADSGILDGFGHKIPGGVAQHLSNLLLKAGLKSRSEKPGLLGRVSILTQSPVDREEAIGVGSFAVASALAGETGYMVSIRRVADHPYRSSFTLVPLAQVANIERKFPAEFLNARGNGIEPGFRDYCLPLLGGPLPEYVSFL